MHYKKMHDVVITHKDVLIYLKNGSNTTIISIPLREAYKLRKYLSELL